MRTVKFGIIGCGLMGREFASAAARWCHLPQMDVKPQIVAVCDANEKVMQWYTDNFSSVKMVTSDYKELLANDEVEAVYIAVPHNLHA
ncbi:MAG TPA: Gfo/Idh/MocA family oxidoreductase, partial [Sedimentisphaerales bacterium]|nr:Gfo/Idh/MocA family oxidoreductase [Sedimentisphaerales bacterium]